MTARRVRSPTSQPVLPASEALPVCSVDRESARKSAPGAGVLAGGVRGRRWARVIAIENVHYGEDPAMNMREWAEVPRPPVPVAPGTSIRVTVQDEDT